MGTLSPVAVTGMGVITALGEGFAQNFGAMLKGEVRSRLPARFSTLHPRPCPVFEIDRDFAPGVPGDASPRLRTAELASLTARAALEDAGFLPGELSGLKVGVVVGTTVGCTLNNESFYRRYLKGEETGTFAVERMYASNPADAIARDLGLAGPRMTILNACSSGTDAVGVAAEWIRSGRADVVVAGGADELCRFTYLGFMSLMVASMGPPMPFDGRRSGLNLGEGAGFLVLESQKSIKARGIKPRVGVFGYGSACDAYHLTAPHPEGIGLRAAIGRALAQWGGKAGDLAFINAHGTSTIDNDKVEGKVMRETLPGVPFHSTKGFTGHTLGAAGGVEAVFAAGFLLEGVAPASAGFGEQDPAIGVEPITQNLKLNKGFAMSNSLAFGGSNASLILGVL